MPGTNESDGSCEARSVRWPRKAGSFLRRTGAQKSDTSAMRRSAELTWRSSFSSQQSEPQRAFVCVDGVFDTREGPAIDSLAVRRFGGVQGTLTIG
jgi:hypothetical protein